MKRALALAFTVAAATLTLAGSASAQAPCIPPYCPAPQPTPPTPPAPPVPPAPEPTPPTPVPGEPSSNPIATAAQVEGTKTELQETFNRTVTFTEQVGPALVYTVAPKTVAGGGASSDDRVPVTVLAMSCLTQCTVRATITLRLNNGKTLRLPVQTQSTGPGGLMLIKARLSAAQVRKVRNAGGQASATLGLRVTDASGTSNATQRATVRVSKKRK